ncbi:MAG: hypothetical protein MUF51_07905 [Vicinamibacteria bacterium]|nr:hypothetical protein [Vicinamibacteria bacterium]
MANKLSRSFMLAGGAFLAFAITAQADTLVLRNGRQVEGELVGINGNVIEFREPGLFGGGRVQRYNRADVRGIELDATGGSSSVGGSGSSGSGSGGYGSGGYGSGSSTSTPSRPTGLREKGLAVTATVPWTDTYIDVRRGQEVYFSASGKISWGKDRKDGPNGEGGRHSNPNRPIPNRAGAALIGKIGLNSTDYFFIGRDESAFRMRDSGRLYLGVNDDFFDDNQGYFTVTVYY